MSTGLLDDAEVDESMVIEFGPGNLIMTWRDSRLDTKRCLCELMDNALGAGARNIVIVITKRSQRLTVSDDGRGCADLKAMHKPGLKDKHPDDRAAKFGIGAKLAQIRLSQGGRVVVVSHTDERSSRFEIDWGQCIAEDKIRILEYDTGPRLPGTSRGTSITIHNLRRLPSGKDLERLLRDLSWIYSNALRDGCKIRFEIEGRTYDLRPYEHPPFEREIEGIRVVDGHEIRYRGGLVKAGVPNPFPGWCPFFGYRTIGRFMEPAGDSPNSQLYFEVTLPRTWPNINPTKDDFAEPPDDLWEALGEACREIIEAASQQRQEFHLSGVTHEAELLLTRTLGGEQASSAKVDPAQKVQEGAGLKGRRPGENEAKPSAKPTGNGTQHSNLSQAQPGDKKPARQRRSLLGRKVSVEWVPDLDGLWEVDLPKGRGSIYIRFNQSNKCMLAFNCNPVILTLKALDCIATAYGRIDKEDQQEVQREFGWKDNDTGIQGWQAKLYAMLQPMLGIE
jgi:hypothetical protein